VSLIADSSKDLEFYDEPKFGFALLIAKAWFNIIGKMDKEKLEELKRFMNLKTFVGEYCGNPSY